MPTTSSACLAVSEPVTPPSQTDHDLLLALNEQVYDLRKELVALHRLMTAMKKSLASTPQHSVGTLEGTEVEITARGMKIIDPIFELDREENE